MASASSGTSYCTCKGKGEVSRAQTTPIEGYVAFCVHSRFSRVRGLGALLMIVDLVDP